MLRFTQLCDMSDHVIVVQIQKIAHKLAMPTICHVLLSCSDLEVCSLRQAGIIVWQNNVLFW